MSAVNKFIANVDAVKEELLVDGKFDGFSSEEWAFVEDVLNGPNAEVFIGLLRKARDRGNLAGFNEERSNNFLRG